MEPRAYLDKKGRVLFVTQAKESDPRFATYWVDKDNLLHRVSNLALPLIASKEQAQENLDAYAEKHELGAAVHPDETTPPSPETAAPTGQGTDQEEGAVSAPPSTSDASREAQIRVATESLAKCWGDYFDVKRRKRLADAKFAAELKSVEEKVHDLRDCIEKLEMGEPLKQGLPFEDGTPEESGEPGVDGPEHRPAIDHNGQCFACGHDAASHLTADGKWRPCVIAGCGCVASETAPAEEGA